MRRSAKNPGFTLIECLVVISIIGILVGLTLSAVQSARAASRRLECADHLRQIGVGIHGFQSSQSHFPSPPYTLVNGNPSISRDYSPLLQILPYLDQGPLYQSVNFNLPNDNGERAENETAQTARVRVFLCPAESSHLLSGPTGPSSYRANIGPAPYFWDATKSWGERSPRGGGGAFSFGYHIGPSDFLDGLSNTAMESEKLLGDDAPAVFDRRRDFWCLGTYPKWIPTAEEIVPLCQDLPSSNPSHVSRSGRTWYRFGFTCTWYNHMITPNSSVPNCTVNGDLPSPELSGNYGGIFGATSGHPGGVNTLFADGSVHFIKDAIHISVWRAVATRSGGESVSAGDY